MALLITPTLLDGFNWLENSPQAWKERAYTDLRNTLYRAPWEPTEAIKRGIDFETNVYRVCSNMTSHLTPIKASPSFQETCLACYGGNFQKKSRKIIAINGIQYCLYGKLDVFFREHIIDLKTTGNYKGPSKYRKGWQNKFYCVMERIQDFTYIIAEWMDAEKGDYRIKKMHYVTVHHDSLTHAENLITAEVARFISFLETDEEMKTGYYKHYNKYN